VRCREITVSGSTTISAFDQEDQKWREKIQNESVRISHARPGPFALEHERLLAQGGDLQRELVPR
jgi:hypothetical protein